jgi:hypothetical protein
MPLHWDEKGENDRRLRPAFEARVWSIGQIVAARAQLKLIAQRPKDAVWPEFADYSCYACHRQLTAHNTPRGRGVPAFGTWHFSMLPLATSATMPLKLDDLAWHVERDKAADAAALAAAQLEPLLVSVAAADYDPQQLQQRMADLLRQGPQRIDGEWDAATQVYLAIAAMQQARIDSRGKVMGDETIARRLGEARQILLRGAHSPQSAKEFGEHIRKLGERL